MKYRKMGNSGLKISALGLGGWTTFGHSLKDQELARQIITTAYENGVNFFDIADQYARGEAEKMMGAVLKDFSRHTLVISSKVFWPMSDDVNDRGLSRKHIMESVHKSLQRIGADYLDLYFCHRYDPDTPLEEVVRAMDDLVHQGKVLYWGTSEWSAAQIMEAYGLCRQFNLYPPQVEQPGYSMLNRERVEKEIIPAVEPKGIGLTTFSPLAMGMLTGKYDDGLPKDSRLAKEDWLRDFVYNDENRERVRQLEPIADELGITRAQLALAWILRQTAVSSVITGATKLEQLESNLQAIEVELDDEVLAKIDEIMPL